MVFAEDKSEIAIEKHEDITGKRNQIMTRRNPVEEMIDNICCEERPVNSKEKRVQLDSPKNEKA